MDPCPKEVMAWEPTAQKYLLGTISLNLVLAMIWQETIPPGNPWRPRWEKRYIWFYDHGRGIPLAERPYEDVEKNRHKAETVLGSTEFICQSLSWGLLQIMGAAARERGFRGDLPELATPDCGLKYGIKHLWEYGLLYGKLSVSEGLRRYNGGPTYADKVLRKLTEIERVV